MKILIKEIEKKLNKKIRKNAISIGWDVAENITGICILRTDEKIIYIDDLQKIETNPKDDIKNRMSYFMGALDKFKQQIKKYKEYKIIIVEDSWFGKSVSTLKSLTRFATLIWTSFYKECDYIEFVLPLSARSQIGFNKNRQLEKTEIKIEKFKRGKNEGKAKKVDIKKLVMEYLKQAFNVDIKDNDEADGFVLALTGLLK